MKDIKLDELELINFKGVRNLFITANGHDINIFGENASGKTTIADGYNWLLFGKDSRDRTDFSIKTLLKSGEPVHHRDHSVRGAFTINGNLLSLKRVFHEVWVKKSNSPKETFSGHETKYYINGVPSRKREYDMQVISLVNGDEKLFKLLSSPTYFNEVLLWKDRRTTLLNICGNVSDSDVIAANKELAELPEIIGDHAIDDFRKIVAEQKKRINSDLKDIPTRIDEATMAKPDLNDQSEMDLQKSAENLQKQINKIDDKIAQIRSGGEVNELKNKILMIQGKQQDLRNGYQADLHKKIDIKRVEYYDRKSSLDKDIRRSIDLNDRFESNKKQIFKLKEQAEDLRHEWAGVNAELFQFTGETVCPTCGRDLQTDKVEDARKHAEEHFNLEKSKRLEAISGKGKSVMTHVGELESENDRISKELTNLDAEISKQQKLTNAVKNEMDELNAGTSSIMDDSEYKAMDKQIADIKTNIRKLQESTDDAVISENEKKNELRAKFSEIQIGISRFDQVRKLDRRIAELDAEEKELTAKFERSEYIQHLLDVFVETKVNLLESKINGRFKLARFKLFDRQVNGGLVECCEMTFNGVPFSDLNNAARINVGLDVISTLSEFYGIQVPIFVDNRESVTELSDTDAQLISLIVSAADKTLRIEKKEPIEEAI
ncbi:AAA family ATPase [Sporolactobacillus pectinivorans]|uniref:AAA family ATPase n=1 Tax=Sporolactobacillus pectinivorans TaxID=1591408 RepID=UPI000C266C02|nr:AAA family ATPase [Sporolactobacillus pectinivorans]